MRKTTYVFQSGLSAATLVVEGVGDSMERFPNGNFAGAVRRSDAQDSRLFRKQLARG
jgi:hypothetical protein